MVTTECPTHQRMRAGPQIVQCAHVGKEWVALFADFDRYLVLTRHGCFVTFASGRQAEVHYQQSEQLMRETGKPCCVYAGGIAP